MIIIPINTDIECLKIANEIRSFGFCVEVEMTNKKLKKSMDFANKEKIPYVIVLGEDEVKKKSFVLKNMFNGNITEVKMNKLDILKELIIK